MKKKVIIIINNLGIGGAERLVVNDANKFIRLGVDLSLVTLAPEPQKSFAGELDLPADHRHCLLFRSLLDLPAWFRLVRFLKRSNADLIITQLWFANTAGRIAALFAGSRRVIAFEQNVYDEVKTWKMFMLDWCLQFFSTKIIAVSEAVKKSLIRHHIHPSRIAVLPNSVDLSRFTVTNGDSTIRQEYGVPKDAFLVLFVGRLIRQKAVDILIAAFKELDQDAFLLIVGQGIAREALERQVADSGLNKRVIFVGVRDDIPGLLSVADCFVLPSRYEGLPLVLTEALAAGRPIIASDFEAASEMIISGQNGLIVPREDVPALAQALKRLQSDLDLRLRLAAEAKRSAERFSISHHAQSLLDYL